MSYRQYTKWLYTDGHERPDLNVYRDHFMKIISEHDRLFIKYKDDDIDESCFRSSNGKTTIWMDEKNRPLHPKGQGRSMMVSKFLCECHGPLKLNPQQYDLFQAAALETRAIVLPGNNQNSGWTEADLIDQVRASPMRSHILSHGLFSLKIRSQKPSIII